MTGCPSTTSVPSPVAPTSPDALAALARACASPVAVAAVISPLKSDSDVTCDDAPADAWLPLDADTLVVTDVAATIEPSVGYENAPSKETASSGAASARVPAAGCPGTMILIAHAR